MCVFVTSCIHREVAAYVISWGVFAHSKILKGIYIGEYTGIVQVYNKAGDNGCDDHLSLSVFTSAHLDGRHLRGCRYMCNYEAAPYPYKFRTVIDARPYGNITRFINHSERNANIEWKEVLYDGLYHIILVSLSLSVYLLLSFSSK